MSTHLTPDPPIPSVSDLVPVKEDRDEIIGVNETHQPPK